MMTIAEKKITVAEFRDMDFEDGYIYELINGIFEMISYAEESGEVESNVLTGLRLEVTNIF